MRITIACAVAALAGCASQPQLTLEEADARASNVEVCEAVFFFPPDVADHAKGEADRRGINCQDYMQAVVTLRQQREANAGAARAAAIQGLMARPIYRPAPVVVQPIQPPQTINCSSYRIGNTVQTNCN